MTDCGKFDQKELPPFENWVISSDDKVADNADNLIKAKEIFKHFCQSLRDYLDLYL